MAAEWAAAAAAEQDEAAAAAAAAAEHHALAAAQALEGQHPAEELILPAGAWAAAGEGALPALAGADAFFPLLAEDAAALEEGEHAALEEPLGLGPAVVAAAGQHPEDPALLPDQLLQLAGDLGLQAEPVALAAAAVVAAGPLPAHLAVLQQLHSLQHMEGQPAGAGPGAIAAAPAGPGMPAEQVAAAAATLQPAALAAVAAAAAMPPPPAHHAGLPPLCPSPSVELSLDGQLPSPE